MTFSSGFRLRRRVTTLFQRFSFWKSLKQGRVSWFQRARFAVRRALGSGYVRVGQESTVPKGYLAVYVGRRSNGEWERVLVPVIQFNHPLFGELLKEAEAEFGYEHPGGITIPCRKSEFEDVRMRIGGGGGRRGMMTWRNWKKSGYD